VEVDGLTFETRYSPLRGENGKVVGLIGVATDITERKRAEKALRESEERFQQVVENAQEWIWEVDAHGLYTYASPIVERILGYKPEDVVGKKHFYDLFHPEDREEPKKAAFEVFAQKQSFREFINRNVRKDGETVWLSTSGVPMLDEEGNLLGYRGADIDITERKRAEEALFQQTREVAVLEERSRLARDLHDAVTQTLFSASLIADVLPRLWERTPDEGQRRLQELRELTRGALAEMRTLLLELRPSALVDAELGDLLRQLAESIIGRARVPVALEMEGECDLPAGVKVALYRIAHEALNNVAKHAGASQATVNLRCRPEHVELHVSDDGRGFDPEGIPLESLGLGIMRERTEAIGAEAIGATLTVESEIGRGTEVMVIWPDIQKCAKDD
jgi:PAS domain S-box-containing protein